MTNQTSEPWVYEGKFATWFIDNSHRAKHRGHWARDGAQYFSGNTDPSLLEQNNVQDGDVWQDTGDSSIVKLRVDGKWLSAYYFWLRGAYLSSTSYFWYVYYNGGTSYYGASNTFGVVLRFSI